MNLKINVALLFIWRCYPPILPCHFHGPKMNVMSMFLPLPTTTFQLQFPDETTLLATCVLLFIFSLLVFSLPIISPLLLHLANSSMSSKVDLPQEVLLVFELWTNGLFRGFSVAYSWHLYHITYHKLYTLAVCLLVSPINSGLFKGRASALYRYLPVAQIEVNS